MVASIPLKAEPAKWIRLMRRRRCWRRGKDWLFHKMVLGVSRYCVRWNYTLVIYQHGLEKFWFPTLGGLGGFPRPASNNRLLDKDGYVCSEQGWFGANRLMGLRAGLWTRLTTRKVSLCDRSIFLREEINEEAWASLCSDTLHALF